MTTSVRLLAASLHYPPDLVLHTASSGPITALDELYLVIERDGQLAGFGEIRENVAYLTDLQPAAVREGISALVRALDWSRPLEDMATQFARLRVDAPAISRALVDTVLIDWAARAKGIPFPSRSGPPSAPTTRPTRVSSSPTTCICRPWPSATSSVASASSSYGWEAAPCARTAPASRFCAICSATASSLLPMPMALGRSTTPSPTCGRWPASISSMLSSPSPRATGRRPHD